MNENKLFDNIARALASPIPRRQAFGHILRGVAGAALASVFGSGTARAAPIPTKPCPPGQCSCGKVCCPQGWSCCNSATGLCCGPGQTCDGKKVKNQYIAIHLPEHRHIKAPGVIPSRVVVLGRVGDTRSWVRDRPRIGSRSVRGRKGHRSITASPGFLA